MSYAKKRKTKPRNNSGAKYGPSYSYPLTRSSNLTCVRGESAAHQRFNVGAMRSHFRFVINLFATSAETRRVVQTEVRVVGVEVPVIVPGKRLFVTLGVVVVRVMAIVSQKSLVAPMIRVAIRGNEGVLDWRWLIRRGG